MFCLLFSVSVHRDMPSMTRNFLVVKLPSGFFFSFLYVASSEFLQWHKIYRMRSFAQFMPACSDSKGKKLDELLSDRFYVKIQFSSYFGYEYKILFWTFSPTFGYVMWYVRLCQFVVCNLHIVWIHFFFFFEIFNRYLFCSLIQ